MGIVLHWIVTNVPALLPVFVVIFVSAILILIYLYKTSEMMNKKILTWLIVSFSVIFIAATVFHLLKNRSPQLEFRLIVFPIQKSTTSDEIDWRSQAIWDMLTEELSRSVGDRAVVSPVEWTAALTGTDTSQNFNYFRNVSYKIGGDHFLIGQQKIENDVPGLYWMLVHTENGESVLNGAFTLTVEKLPDYTQQVSKKILDNFDMEAAGIPTVINLIEQDNYKKYLDAQDRFNQKKYAEAAQMAEEVVSADFSFMAGFMLSGKSWFMAALDKKKTGESPVEEFEKARSIFSKIIEMDSSQAEALAYLGEYYVYQERWSLAEENLLKAFRTNPNLPRLYLTLSRLHSFRYEKIGFDNEEELFQRAIFINPCYEEAYLMLADYYLFENKRAKAIETLERYSKIDPNSVPTLIALGKIYLVRNEILKIIEIFNKVIELEPNNSDAYYNLGILYYNSKEFETSEKLLQRAIAIDNHLNAHLYLAYLYEAKGDYEKAIEHLRTRIRHRKGLDDKFAEEARKHLYKLMHQDSTKIDNDE